MLNMDSTGFVWPIIKIMVICEFKDTFVNNDLQGFNVYFYLEVPKWKRWTELS